MTMFERVRVRGRAMLADESAGSATYHALLIGLSVSVVLVVVRIGTTLAAGR
jgi:hypothetical protein